MSISIEIVPRNKNFLHDSFNLFTKEFSQINMINIPDLIRFPIRSWDACGLARGFFNRRIPHIRSKDFSLENLDNLLDHIDRNGIDELLIISGDNIEGHLKDSLGLTPVILTRSLLKLRPNLKIYGGLDPYRWSMEQELEYSKQKMDAGIVGFFTQPFFDLDNFIIYKQHLPNVELFLGVSPVLTENNKLYWKNINKVVFPKGFQTTMQWNESFAHDVLELVTKEQINVYFMPIKIDLFDYFTRVFR